MRDSHTKRIQTKRMRRQRAHLRLRNRVQGTLARPRLAVFKSLRYIYAQVIDDQNGRTLAQASSAEPELKQALKGSTVIVFDARGAGEIVTQSVNAERVMHFIDFLCY